MDIWDSMILGFIQGITEFLPISSSGHLVLAQRILGICDGALTLDILLHVGTLLALLMVFWNEWLYIVRHPFSRLGKLVWVASIPTALIGILCKDWFDSLFESGKSIGFEFLLTGWILWISDGRTGGVKNEDTTTYLDACTVGILQGAAIMPALSRSGLTISGALFRGLERTFAAKFSFLVSIPVIFGATLLEIKDLWMGGTPTIAFGPAFVGCAVAAISGYVSIRYMLRIVATKGLRMFSVYVWALGILILLDQFVFHVWL
jgi:undecaprenyl-diphosphatase